MAAGNPGRVPPLFSANSIHARTSGESRSQRGCVLVLPDAVVVIAARLRQSEGGQAPDQRGVHHMDLHEHRPHEHRVDVHMIDAHIEREVVRALNDPEPEAIPLQRAGGGQDMVLAIQPASSRRAWLGRTRYRWVRGWSAERCGPRRGIRTNCDRCRADEGVR